MQARQFETVEIVLTGPEPKCAATDVKIDGTFKKDGQSMTVPGFYAGDGKYVIRYYPKEAGNYTWKTGGAVAAEGGFTAEPAVRHGMVRAEGTHFRCDDGSWFYPFGTTIYALAHQTKELTEETFQTLGKSPFNKVRLCVFPKDYLYNKNEPEYFPFLKREDGSWDVTRPDFRFWDSFEEKLRRLQDLGIEADLILFHPYDRWGFADMTQKDNLTYLSYLLKRFAAFPNIWWSLANEYDFVSGKTMEDWCEIEEFVRDNDPYHHLESCHNGFHYWDATRPAITHSSLQVKNCTVVSGEMRKTGKPVMIDECCYEGNLNQPWGSISGQEMTARFWQTVTRGGYCTHGETFLDPECKNEDDAVVYWSKGGKLRGESPKRIAWLRELLESFPGPIDPVAGAHSLFEMPEDEIRAAVPTLEKRFQPFVLASLKMTPYEKTILSAGEYTFDGHVGEEVYLWYLYRQTSARYAITLPKEHFYTVEVLDTWNMTRRVFCDHVNGQVQVRLPGKEYMAVLARREA